MRFKLLLSVLMIVFGAQIVTAGMFDYNDTGTWNTSAWDLPQAAAPLNSCPSGTTTGVLMLFFVAFVIFGVFVLNLMVLKLPILNLLPAAGLLVFGFTLFYCAWFLAFICWALGIGMVMLMWNEV
jgi:hypothetical protein